MKAMFALLSGVGVFTKYDDVLHKCSIGKHFIKINKLFM